MGAAKALGIDIGSSAVRGVEISISRNGPRLERYASIALPPGAVSAGDVLDEPAVIAALKRLVSVGKFSSKRVALGVANQRVVVRQVDLPWMPADELRSALAFQVADLLPIPVAEALLEYHPIEEFVGEGGSRMLRAMLVAADAAMVGRSLAVLRAAGLRPEVVDLTPFALLRAAGLTTDAWSAADAGRSDNEAVVDVGAAITNIIIHAGGVPRFVRILTLGGEDVTESLAEQLGIARDDAEQRKCAAAPAIPGPRAPDPDLLDSRLIETATATLVEAIRGSLDYYRGQSGARPLTRIVLSGGGALVAGLAAQLTAATQLPVQVSTGLMGLPRGSGVPADVVEQGCAFGAVPLGLALRMAA